MERGRQQNMNQEQDAAKQPIVIENRQLYKTLAVVALPIALQNLIASSLSLIDNLMVGSLGEAELTAVGLATQIFFIQWMMLFGFCSGCATFIAQFWGRRDLRQIRKVVGFALTVCLSFSALFFTAAFFFPEKVLSVFTNIPGAIEMGKGYVRAGALVFLCTSITVPFTTALRATQQTARPLLISSTAFIINTILNYILIFGKLGAPQLGIVGAAIATVIARLLETSLTLYVVFGRNNVLKGKVTEFFGWNKAFVKGVVGNALPTTINETMWGMGTAAYNAAYGRIGITAFAAVQASSTIQNMFTMAFFSLGDAMLILVGQQLGKKEMDYAYALAKRLYKIGVIVGVLGGLALIASAPLIVSWFHFTPEGKMHAIRILTIYGVFMGLRLFNGLSITGSLRAGGDTKFAMFAELGVMWLIGVPLVWTGALIWCLPVYAIVLLAQIEDLLKCALLLRRFLSKKWLKNIIQGME